MHLFHISNLGRSPKQNVWKRLATPLKTWIWQTSLWTLQTGPISFLRSRCSQLVTAQGFLLVRGPTLDTRHRPAVSRDAPWWLTELSPKPVRRREKRALLCSSFNEKMVASLRTPAAAAAVWRVKVEPRHELPPLSVTCSVIFRPAENNSHMFSRRISNPAPVQDPLRLCCQLIGRHRTSSPCV